MVAAPHLHLSCVTSEHERLARPNNRRIILPDMGRCRHRGGDHRSQKWGRCPMCPRARVPTLRGRVARFGPPRDPRGALLGRHRPAHWGVRWTTATLMI
jgi:hypothetical protein